MQGSGDKAPVEHESAPVYISAGLLPISNIGECRDLDYPQLALAEPYC